jgi:putative membrane protein
MLMRTFLAIIALAATITFMPAADPAALHENDIAFAKKAAVGGLLEVRSSEAALKRTTLTAEEQAFARQLIADHGKANDELAAIAKRKGIAVPTELGSEEQEKLAKAAEIKDKDFNEEYLEHQISCHKKTIDLFEDQAEDGKDSDLKAFASKHLPTLKAHLETAKRLEAKY